MAQDKETGIRTLASKEFSRNLLRSQDGVLTLDFIFAFIFVWGMMMVLLAITLTLSVSEVVQYITFSAARVYNGAHITPDLQKALAMKKFAELTQSPGIAPLFSNGWYSLSSPAVSDEFSKTLSRKPEPNRDLFSGFQVTFVAHVLDMKLPLLGSTSDEESGGFSAKISSYLTREPSDQECMQFNAARFKKIREMEQGFKNQLIKDERYVAFGDNGC